MKQKPGAHFLYRDRLRLQEVSSFQGGEPGGNGKEMVPISLSSFDGFVLPPTFSQYMKMVSSCFIDLG